MQTTAAPASLEKLLSEDEVHADQGGVAGAQRTHDRGQADVAQPPRSRQQDESHPAEQGGEVGHAQEQVDRHGSLPFVRTGHAVWLILSTAVWSCVEEAAMDASFRERYGPWALVTGASSGIGREIAVQAAERGVDVLLAGRDSARLQEGRSRVVLPGVLTKVLHNATFGLPRAAKVRVMGRIMRRMT